VLCASGQVFNLALLAFAIIFCVAFFSIWFARLQQGVQLLQPFGIVPIGLAPRDGSDMARIDQ
jgi:hypothetical protein